MLGHLAARGFGWRQVRETGALGLPILNSKSAESGTRMRLLPDAEKFCGERFHKSLPAWSRETHGTAQSGYVDSRVVIEQTSIDAIEKGSRGRQLSRSRRTMNEHEFHTATVSTLAHPVSGRTAIAAAAGAGTRAAQNFEAP